MSDRRGFTLIETLVVLAVLAAVAATILVLPTSQLARDTSLLARFVASKRSSAITSGTSTGAFGADCTLLTDAAFSRSVASVRVPPRGLLFTPDGLPRTCDGGGVGNTTILLEHRGHQAAVIVSSLGRVRWELR